jgi:transmembrane sensor
MNTTEEKEPDCSSAELDEAAVWMARLHAPERTASVERGFRRWLAEKPSHAAAFETISTAWDLTGALQRRPFPKLTRWERAGFRSGFLRAAAAVGSVAALAILAIIFYVRAGGYATAVGEQRVLTLDDGTRVTLNTSSRVVIDYSESERRVNLKQGEALFEVARNPGRPFIVVAGEQLVRALGTEFIVRRDERQLAVTLLEGKVTVSPEAHEPPGPPPGRDTPAAGQAEVFTLTPGQRLTLSSSAPPHLDSPSINQLSAWRLGQVELDDASLAEAVAEMNRYSATQLIVATPQAAALRINGVFRVGDAAGFAAAVARSYGLKLERRAHQLVLAGIPADPQPVQAAEK